MSILNKKTIYAYLSLFQDKPHWKLGFPSDKDFPKNEVPIGTVVYSVLNRIIRIKDDGQILSKYEKDIDIEIKFTHGKDVWYPHYEEILHLIENKSEMDIFQKNAAYRRYSQLAYFLCYDADFEEWIDFVEDCKKTSDITNPNYTYSEVIVDKGRRLSDSGVPYTCYEVEGFEYLFILDLWELLFNPNVEDSVKKCQYCDDFFYTTVNQQKYCSDCKEPKQYNKIKNARAKENEAGALFKKIYDILRTRDETGDEIRAFLDENQYHKDRLKGKPVEPNPNYADISTEEEYLHWLGKYHSKILKRPSQKKAGSKTATKQDESNQKKDSDENDRIRRLQEDEEIIR